MTEPKDSFESAMAMNSIALSPLLIRRLGPVRKLVDDWCKDLGRKAENARDSLRSPMPSPAERESLPVDIIVRHIDQLMELGLARGRRLPIAQLVEEDLAALVTSMRKVLAEVEGISFDQLVTYDACSVFRDEPRPPGSRLSDLISRRSRLARVSAPQPGDDAASHTARFIAASRMEIQQYEISRMVLCYQILGKPLPSHWGERVEAACRLASRLPGFARIAHHTAFPPDVDCMVDHAILILRHELLEDVTDALRAPNLAARGTCRARQISKNAQRVRALLKDVYPGQRRAEKIRGFCEHMFAESRVDAMQRLLSHSGPRP